MVNSKRKGKVGELEAAKFLQETLGCSARRGQQFKGSPDSPDIVHDIPGIHIEVKRVEKLNVSKALEQATKDKGDEDIPMVLHRPNRVPWMVTIWGEDLPEFCKRILAP